MANPDDWDTLRKLVGIFLDSEIEAGVFNPDVTRLAEANPESFAAECLKEDILNHHYRCAMSGESTKNSDFRKAVKVKAPKKKDPLKGKLPREQKEKKKKGKTWKFTPAVKTTKTTQKGNLPRSAVFSLRKEPSKNSKTSEFRADERYGLCLLYTSPSPRDYAASRMPSSA